MVQHTVVNVVHPSVFAIAQAALDIHMTAARAVHVSGMCSGPSRERKREERERERERDRESLSQRSLKPVSTHSDALCTPGCERDGARTGAPPGSSRPVRTLASLQARICRPSTASAVLVPASCKSPFSPLPLSSLRPSSPTTAWSLRALYEPGGH